MRALSILIFTPVLTIGQSGNLDQIRNGPASNPSMNFYTTFSNPKWVNGNAGPSNAHYLEGMSIAYRSLITGAISGQSYEYVIEYDTRHSGRMAIDYLTHYQRLEPHGSFGHDAEVINPRIFKSGNTEYLLGTVSTNTFPIPAPFQAAGNTPVAGMPQNSFNALPAGERTMTIYNGIITSITYDLQQSLTIAATKSSTRVRIRFTAEKDSVVLAWGGHIASRLDWGCINVFIPRFAGDISDSSYHMRQISINTYPGLVNIPGVGNQDRSLSATAVVSVKDNTAPTVVSCPSNGEIECPETPQFGNPSFTDDCDQSLDVTFNDVTTPGCGNTFSVTRTWTAKDDGGNIATCSQTIAVVDKTRPSITCPGTVVAQCDADVPAPNIDLVTTSDACGKVTVTWEGDASSGSCPKIITRTYKATDACGNTNTCTQTINVNDITPPVITCPPDIVVECGSNTDPVNTGTATATDDCSAEVFYVDELVSKNCFNPYIIRTWIARDPCNNRSTCEQNIILVDRTAPVVICSPDLQINCGDPIPTPVSPVFFETCSPTLTTVLYREVPAEASGCPANPNNINRTWTHIDASGNIGTCVQKVTFVPASLTSTSAAITTTGKTVTVTTQPVDKTGSIPLKGNLSALQVRADPNPYSSVINFRFVSPQSGQAMLVVYNLTGTKMAVVYNGNVTAGLLYTVNYKVPLSQRVPLVYKLSVGANSAQGKLLSFGRNFNQ